MDIVGDIQEQDSRIQCHMNYYLLGICYVAHSFPGTFMVYMLFHCIKYVLS